VNNRIHKFDTELNIVTPGFIHYDFKNYGLEQIYYWKDNGKVIKIICEGATEKWARKILEENLPLII